MRFSILSLLSRPVPTMGVQAGTFLLATEGLMDGVESVHDQCGHDGDDGGDIGCSGIY